MAGAGKAKYGPALRFRPGDAAAAAAVLLCALALGAGLLLSAPAGDTASVQVYRAGALVWEHPLSEDGEFRLSGDYENLIVIRDGRVAILESSCPGGDCIRMGWVSSPGRSIVCLPNRVEVRLTGVSGVDAVVG